MSSSNFGKRQVAHGERERDGIDKKPIQSNKEQIKKKKKKKKKTKRQFVIVDWKTKRL